MIATVVLGLQDQYESSMMKKKALEEELEDLEGKLLRAEKLLSGDHSSTTSLAPIQSAAQSRVILLHLPLVRFCVKKAH